MLWITYPFPSLVLVAMMHRKPGMIAYLRGVAKRLRIGRKLTRERTAVSVVQVYAVGSVVQNCLSLPAPITYPGTVIEVLNGPLLLFRAILSGVFPVQHERNTGISADYARSKTHSEGCVHQLHRHGLLYMLLA